MFNLLPEPEKKQILDEYKIRRYSVALAFLFVVGLIAIVSVFPSFVLSELKLSEANSNLASVKNNDLFQQADALNSELSKANAKLVALHPAGATMSVSSVINTINSHKNNNIRLSGFLYAEHNVDSFSSVSVNGIARSREDLSAFVDELKKDSSFKTVDLPVSSFTKDENADFTLTVTGAF